MNRIKLIIETPRAGELGHRILKSHTEISDETAGELIANSRKALIGENYVSVKKDVKQILKNGTVREGIERILLAGVDVRRLSDAQIEKVTQDLSELYEKLQRLIESSDWKTGQDMVISRPELQDWINKPQFLRLPAVATGPTGPQPPPPDNWLVRLIKILARLNLAKLILAGLILAAVLVAFIVFWFRDVSPPPPPPPPPPEERIQTLLTDWGCSKDQLAESLLRAVNWDRRKEVKRMDADSLLGDGEVSEMIDKLDNKHDTPDRFFASPAVEQETVFRQFVIDQGVSSPRQALDLRKWLFDSSQKLLELRKAAGVANHSLSLLETTDPYITFLDGIARQEFDAGFGDDFREPSTPLFERQDVMIFRELGRIKTRLEDLGVVSKTNADLGVFLSSFRINGEEIETSRKNAVDEVTGKTESAPEDPVSIRASYLKLQEFLEQLSNFRHK
jgi:hypothetical protein